MKRTRLLARRFGIISRGVCMWLIRNQHGAKAALCDGGLLYHLTGPIEARAICRLNEQGPWHP